MQFDSKIPCIRLLESTDGRYIEEDIDFASRRPSNRKIALAMYAGYKFEELSTLPKWWDDCTRKEIETRNENVVDNIQQYCSIVKTQLGSSSIVMGGEVDCLWGMPLACLANEIINLNPPRIQSLITLN
jgi:hypothetical protein